MNLVCLVFLTFFRSGGDVVVNAGHINYIEKYRDGTKICLTNKTCYAVRDSIHEVVKKINNSCRGMCE